jgi:malonyl-CoA/methylmalonyl-CoA synthetase
MNLYDLFEIARRRAPEKIALRLSTLARAEGAPGTSGAIGAPGASGAGRKPDAVVARPATGPAGASDAIEWSYDALLRRAEALAAGLLSWGLRPGDRVACMLGSGAEAVLLHLALLRLGAVLVPLNPAYRRRELGHILGDAAPRLLVVEGGLRAQLDEVAPEQRASLETVVLAEEMERWFGSEAPAVAARSVNASAVTVATARAAGAAAAGGDALAMLPYTSGTTGSSKGAMLSHNNLLATVTGLLAAWSWQPTDVLLLVLPLFHVHGLLVGLDCALAAGATVELRRRFEAAATFDELASGRATVFFGVPTIYVRLVEELRRRVAAGGPAGAGPGIAGMRLFCSGSAPLAAETFAAFRELTGHDVLERYGMTEAGMILSNSYAGARHPGQVGTPLPGVSVRIAAEDGRDLPAGEAGELLVRGGNVFAGYWQAPEKTAASFVHDDAGRRWFRTGDLARQDPGSGAFTLLGRRHELVIAGGFNIYPREIEEVLLAYPGIREAAVVGRPDPEWGEAVVAYLVADPPPDQAALFAFCKTQLAAFKVPRRLHLLETLPRNALGKLQKHLLP